MCLYIFVDDTIHVLNVPQIIQQSKWIYNSPITLDPGFPPVRQSEITWLAEQFFSALHWTDVLPKA